MDECGALNEWLQIAPHAQAVCSEVGALVNMSDFAIRPALAMKTGDVLQTGIRRYRFIQTRNLPHGWDAGVLFEEKDKTLFCSDLLHRNGDAVALTDKDILESHRASLLFHEAGSQMNYTPYNLKIKGCCTVSPTCSPKHWRPYIALLFLAAVLLCSETWRK